MASYQGRALRGDAGRARTARARGSRRVVAVLRVLAAIAIVVALAHLPWDDLRRKVAIIDAVEVQGTQYLDAARVREVAGLAVGGDLIAASPARARQSLLLHPRIADATVIRRWPRSLVVRIVEREPVMLVARGVPWELDRAGVLLPPLAEGVVADVPMLTGPDFSGIAAGTRLETPDVKRGLAWVEALANPTLQLQAQVSEVDVHDPEATRLVLMSGTRVLAPAWPPGVHELSAIRVVLADLQQRGTTADEVDARFEGQVIVRPAAAEGDGTKRKV